MRASVQSPNAAAWPGRAYGASAYAELLARLPRAVAASRLTLCGMGACVDARVALQDMREALDAPAEAAALVAMLRDRAARGIGGEVFIDWEQGADWLARHVPVQYALGGTGPQAGWALTAVGAEALVALEDRSAHMLARLPPGLKLAGQNGTVAAEQAMPRGEKRPDIFIFEYTAGVPTLGIAPPRSSRIIVRFSNLGLEHDPAFDRLSLRLASSAGAGLLSGFSAVPAEHLAAETLRVASLGRAWRAAGLGTVHLELAGYDSAAMGESVLAGLRGAITSVGMSESEFRTTSPIRDLAGGLVALGERLGLARVCVHADHWAASATLGDPDREHDALMMGCLLASARAAAGQPTRPTGLHPAAEFRPPPFPRPLRRGAWTLVSCQAPYLAAPATTLGLGDTFTAGCLLVLGSRA